MYSEFIQNHKHKDFLNKINFTPGNCKSYLHFNRQMQYLTYMGEVQRKCMNYDSLVQKQLGEPAASSLLRISRLRRYNEMLYAASKLPRVLLE